LKKFEKGNSPKRPFGRPFTIAVKRFC